MRLSTALLADTSVRLAELSFPHTRVLLHRTRLAFIHIDKLLHYAKADRDGRVDGFIAVSLPTEVILFVLKMGELSTVISFTEAGRAVRAIPAALKHIKREAERGEITYCAAPMEQLVWMHSSCANPPAPLQLDLTRPDRVLPELMADGFNGVLELIVDGRVNYLLFDKGVYRSGHFYYELAGRTVQQYMQEVLEPDADGRIPEVAASVVPPAEEYPEQAAPLLIQTYRELFWAIAKATEAEIPGEGMKRVERVRDLQANVHTALHAIGAQDETAEQAADDLVSTPQELMFALSDWALQLLEDVEVIAPGIAPQVLQEATREQRFMLQKAGFYDRLPWTVSW
jgi:hypothetical protein